MPIFPPFLPTPAEFNADMAASIFAIGGVQFTLPSVPRLLGQEGTGLSSIPIAPLGGLPILEGNAFLMQKKGCSDAVG